MLVSDIATQDYVSLPAGQQICLHYNTEGGDPVPLPANYQGGGSCYDGHFYPSVIDLETDPHRQPTGIAVQAQGPILAVAHGMQGEVRLFNKSTGSLVGTIQVPASNFADLPNNQLGIAPNGDLWVIAGGSLRRYTQLDTTPTLAATANGFARPLAVAVHPSDDNLVYVADGAGSQQLKNMDRHGILRPWTFGQATTDPTVSNHTLSFAIHYTNADPNTSAADTYALTEATSIAVQADGSLWVIDSAASRLLHIDGDGNYVDQVAYRPASYISTVDPNATQRVFSNFLEYEVDTDNPLQPGDEGTSWRLVRNWRTGFPNQAVASTNLQWAGLNTVTTLSNGRTYALANMPNQDTMLVELPTSGPARDTGIRLNTACPGAILKCVLYENGDLGYAIWQTYTPSYPSTYQQVMRKRLLSFDANANPVWGAPAVAATIFVDAANDRDQPYFHGVSASPLGPRFPLTSSGKMIFFDPSACGDVDNAAHPFPAVFCNNGFHLGAFETGWGAGFRWRASPSAALDGKGSYQTWTIDHSTAYAGNNVWARGQHIVYGYHGEFHRDMSTSNFRVGQANQFMHFHQDGLFIGQFGVPGYVADPATEFAAPGVAGNSFGNALVQAGPNALYWYHNDESVHAGVHRWRITHLDSLKLMAGMGLKETTINLQPLP